MMTRLRSIALAGVLILTLFGLEGCTVGQFAWLYPQSHFDYPNSNITPIGKVHGEASTVSVFFPVMMDADLQEEAYKNALQQKGGDMIIDFLATTEVVMYPIAFINIFKTTYKVDGTAAKMEIGKQILR